MPDYVTARLKSFGYAAAGIATLLREQPHARLHLLATVMVVMVAAWLQVTALEWSVLLLAIAVVWVAEALNTGLEYLADAVKPEQHPLVGKAKDVAAGGVLIAAICAVAVGISVLWPYLQHA